MAYPTTTEHSKLYPFTSIMASPYSCDPTGVMDCTAAIETLKANQSNIGTIYIPKGTFKIETNLTIPIGMKLIFEIGGSLAIAIGVTLTLSGTIKAENHQIFSCSGTGKVVFGSGALKEAYPEWWGAKADNATDCAAAIAAWLTAVIDCGAKGVLAAGTYKCNSETILTMAAGKSLIVEGVGGKSVLDFSGITNNPGYGATETYSLKITGTPSSDPNNVVRLTNFRLVGGDTVLGGKWGLRLASMGQTNLVGVMASGFGLIGIGVMDTVYANFYGCYACGNYYSGLHISGGVGARVFGGEFNNNGPGYPYDGSGNGFGYGVIANAQQAVVIGIRAVDNSRYGIDCRGGSNIVIDGNYVYNSGLIGIHCPNYDIAPSGGVNVKIVNNTVDNCDRVSSSPYGNQPARWGIYTGPSHYGSSWTVPVDQILISGNTVKRPGTDQAIMVEAHKLTDTTTSLKKLIIKDNSIEVTDPTTVEATTGGAISVGWGLSEPEFVDACVVKDNIIRNGNIALLSDGRTADISGNKFSFSCAPGSLYYDSVVRVGGTGWTELMVDFNSVKSDSGAFTCNPFFEYNTGLARKGLFRIKSMRGNLVNGASPACIEEYVNNKSVTKWTWRDAIAAQTTRGVFTLISDKSVKATGTIYIKYSMSSGTDAAPAVLGGLFAVSYVVDNSGNVTLPGASPYSVTPYATSNAIESGSPTILFQLWAATDGIQLTVYPNVDMTIICEVLVEKTGSYASMTINNEANGRTYIQ